MCNSFWQDNILPKFMFLKYCPNAKPTTALPKFCLTLGCVIFIFLLKHFLEIVWLSSLLLQSMDIFGSKIFLQGPLKGVKTRLGLQCRTPLRFYLLTVIPYPLSLPLVPYPLVLFFPRKYRWGLLFISLLLLLFLSKSKVNS